MKYNRRVRAGRGFSLAELKVHPLSYLLFASLTPTTKEAGISRRYAPTVGIAVDPRRANLSVESLKVNVERLKEYQARLIVFPRKAGVHKRGDASKEDVSKAKSADAKVSKSLRRAQPVLNRHPRDGVAEIKKSELPKGEQDAYRRLREIRSEARLVGVREKRAKDKAEEAANAKK